MIENTRIVLADDHTMLRQGLRWLLDTEPGMEVIGEAEDGRKAVAMVEMLLPDVVLMDINMPELNGIDSTRQIRAGKLDGDGPKVIALSGYVNRRHTSEMLRAGAMGFVIKESAFAELTQAVRSVIANKVYLSPTVAGMLVEEMIHRGDSNGQTHAELSPREREVLQLIAEGKATKEAAAHLHVSVKTVETHRRNIMDKLSLDSVAEMTKYAIRHGITSLD